MGDPERFASPSLAQSAGRVRDGDVQARQAEIVELLTLADRRIATLERALQAERKSSAQAHAQRDALARRLEAAAPRLDPDPVHAQVLDEAKQGRGRRVLVWVAIVGLVVGILAVIDAFVTLVFEEPVSKVFQAQAQRSADSKLKVEEREFARAPVRKGEDPQHRIQRLALTLQHRKHAGDQLGRLTIPAIGLRTIFFEGAVGTGGEASLRKGAAHYEDTRMPGIDGTVGIAGHRTTFGAPFRRINELKPGNRIIVRMPYAKFTYAVESEKIVAPTTVSVLKSSESARTVSGGPPTTQKVVLTACHPIGSDAQRIVVTGRLLRFDPITRTYA